MKIDNQITMTDHMSHTLRSIIKTVNTLMSNIKRVNDITKRVGADGFDRMRRKIISAKVSLESFKNNLIQMSLAQRHNTDSANSWYTKLMGIYSAVGRLSAMFNALSRIMNFANGYTTANTRLNLINDGLQTQLQLQKQIADAANRSRSSYKATANLVASIGMTGAMDSTKAAIDFSEKVNKLLVIGGADATQSYAAISQLSQAFTSGNLQGDGFRSLRDNAPALMGTIADGVGVSMSRLEAMSEQGLLTSDVIISAMEKAGDGIDNQFEKMPVTFFQNMQMMKDTFGVWASGLAENGALKAVNELFKKLNMWLSSSSGQRFLSNIATALSIIAYFVLLISDGFSAFMNILDMISPVADTLFFAVIIAGALLAGQALWAMVPSLWAMVTPALATAGSFILMNLPLIGVALAIAAVIVLLQKLGVKAETIATFIGGLVAGQVAFFLNVINFVRNMLLSVAEFLMNIFIDPVYAVKKLFYDLTKEINTFFSGMINGLIDGLNWLITKTNSIAGTKIEKIAHVELSTLEKPVSKRKGVVNLDKYKGDYKSYSDFAKLGAGIANTGLNKMKSAADGFGMRSMGKVENIDTVGKVGKIDSDVNVAKEDLKYLLDAVTQKYVNNINLTVQTQAPVINNNGTVREEADIQKVATMLSDILIEETVVSV